jgi:hypothetical protein
MPSYVVHITCLFDSYEVVAPAANPMVAVINALQFLDFQKLENVVGIEISPQ